MAWVHALGSGRKESIAAVGAGIRWGGTGWQLALDLARVVNDVTGAPDPNAIRLHLGALVRF